MPEVTALLLALDVHPDSRGLTNIQGVVHTLEWDSESEAPPQYLPHLWLVAIVRLSDDELHSEWESRYEWWHDGACLYYFEHLPKEITDSWFIMATKPPGGKLRLSGDGSYRLSLKWRRKGESQWSEVMASAYVDVEARQLPSAAAEESE